MIRSFDIISIVKSRGHGSSLIVVPSFMDHTWIIRAVLEVSSCDFVSRKKALPSSPYTSSNDSKSSKWDITVDSFNYTRFRMPLRFLISDFQALDPTSGSYWIASSIWATLDANRSPENGRSKSESCSPPERDVIAYEKR